MLDAVLDPRKAMKKTLKNFVPGATQRKMRLFLNDLLITQTAHTGWVKLRGPGKPSLGKAG
ncbi:hypothetical protein LEMLEM_LOCUS18623 [Lemmus lemmus]